MLPTSIKGRGAAAATPGRFAVRRVEPDGPPEPTPAPDTRLTPINAGRIISTNRSPDVPFERSINPYQGCEHGCVYCYARPSHSYLDLSPGLDFETKIFYKPNAVDRLLAEWEKPGYVCKPITLGANTDPYQPAEKSLGITRALLSAFLKHKHPVSLISKGGLMRRDLDLIAELAALKLVSVGISIPTADNALKRILEPRVPAADVRFALIAELRQIGVPVSLLLAPVIPAVNDREIEAIVGRAADAGAQRAAWILLRLPHELKTLFRDWLNRHLPERAARVMSLMRQASGGRDYDNRFGARQSGTGAYADMISQRFVAACRKHGIEHGGDAEPLERTLFTPPGKRQISFDF